MANQTAGQFRSLSMFDQKCLSGGRTASLSFVTCRLYLITALQLKSPVANASERREWQFEIVSELQFKVPLISAFVISNNLVRSFYPKSNGGISHIARYDFKRFRSSESPALRREFFDE